jgi:hypothetical protein
MQLFIEGYRSHNYYLYNAITDAAYFYAEQLLGKRLMKNLELDIKLTKDLKQKEGAYGYCLITDDNVNSPREFHIEIDTSMKHSIRDILTWLAHEMTHVKQFVKGELFDYQDGSVQWKSKRYRRNLSYSKSPWEREAYRMENKLYKELRNEY